MRKRIFYIPFLFAAFISGRDLCWPGLHQKLIFQDDFSSNQISNELIIEKPVNENDPCSIVNAQLQLNSEGGARQQCWIWH
jgi:hypothetical protein